ncbi:Fur-regulated basic protein A [Oceanobacillus limi]|uniref:Fur-regulated basic protein A n=1 Tax=Oceanobacillus limi TaxID=930131 RepID=A0A1I0HLP4_9BACI|nr:Fur-regulated basic protein FbpA [Oceanobacillus limi]SET84950.1 Fur-regulated basic protein A [Oceanobacillus limi]
MNDIAERKDQQAAQDRKNDLINSLYQMGVYETSDGRVIDEVSLYTLEWTYVEELNKAAKAYEEVEK